MNFLADLMADPGWDGARDPFAVTEDDVVAYLHEIPAQGQKRTLLIKTLRSFYGWLAERDGPDGRPLIVRNPMRHIRPVKIRDRRDAPSLSPDQLELVLACAERVDPRARWAMQLQYATACRAGSLVALVPSDLEQTPKGPKLHFREAKGDLPYTVVLGTKAQEAWCELIALIDYKPPTATGRRPTIVGVGYTQYENWVKRAEALSGVAVRSHLLRHTALTRMAEDPSVDVRTIMEFANWQDPSQFRRYAKARDQGLRYAAEVL